MSGGAKLSKHYRRLVGTAKQLAKAGLQEEPKWLRALERCPPLPLEETRKPKPKPIVFPEDRFIQGFYDRYPQAKQFPVDLASEEAPPAKRFALRQLHLVQRGMSPRVARDQVTAEFEQSGLLRSMADCRTSMHIQKMMLRRDIKIAQASSKENIVELLQADEETALQHAMLETSLPRA